MDIQNMIEKYGPEITKTLKIASTQLYDKVLWYVRIDGVLGLVSWTLVFAITLLFGLRIFKWIKKESKDTYNTEGYWFIGAVGLISVFLISSLVIGELATNTAKIVAPEYWIINQIINTTK